ncbi:STAM binding protein [Massariosphaeria phaeospora]|uniref:STAM binding protein n=1 Tax=Massariosphaeria phaeospora TaxID=100035 RepID=A0A7C8M591_9PLEO|nr:STAM binding protein [Massariosphaeria phaeospora]
MASLGAPLGVPDLTKQAENYEYNGYIPLKSWLRSASTMQKEAQVYEAEGNDPQTYLLLYRHANLVLDKLLNHPQKSLPENRKALNAATAAVNRDLRKLEEIKPRIAKRHNEYQERRKVQLKALESLEGKGAARTLQQDFEGLSLNRSSAKRRSYEKAHLDAEGNRSLAAKLAQREVRRRDVARRSVRQAGVSEDEEHERRVAGMWGDWETELKRQSGEADDDLSSQIQEVARMQQNGQKAPNFSVSSPCTAIGRGTHASQRPTSYQPTSTYQYPSVPHKSAQERWSGSDTRLPTQGTGPIRPPKELFRGPFDATPEAPALPPKSPTAPPSIPIFEQPRAPPIPGKYVEGAPSAPAIPAKLLDSSSSTPRPSSPSTDGQDLDEFTFKPSAYLENGEPLRSIFLPQQLRHQFLSAASKNTRLNLETCGILCGILKSNALFITRLVIPEQTSTSDTCETVNEGEIFDYCDKEELMVLGWIHTHPSQTCFMSSRDLHTHVGYQVMMSESIAIVCAPSKEPSWGCFRLTDPPGKQAILNCSQPGIFHPHHVDNIYTGALKPGHVVELANAPLELVDMRPGK